jgi:hypothetical protein
MATTSVFRLNYTWVHSYMWFYIKLHIGSWLQVFLD